MNLVTWEVAKRHKHDASGLMAPEDVMWYKENGVYYPEIPSEPDESMDGDWDSGMASAGFGTDEDYGYHPEGEEF